MNFTTRSALPLCFLVLALACRNRQPPAAAPVPVAAGKDKSRSSKPSDTIRGRAVKIADGDTFNLLVDDTGTVRVRLSGIDAPEKSQPFGNKSREALGALLDHPPVTVVVRDRDRYGRLVCDVYNEEDVWINQTLVQKGWAWHYTDYSKDESLAAAERAARASRSGLWADASPTPPWEFRKEKRNQPKKKKTKNSARTPASR